MNTEFPTLHMLCGKIGSGKSTLASQLASRPSTVMLSEDTWLGALFSDQMSTPNDYMRCAAKLRGIMGAHVGSMLTAGVSVVLDFPANTPETRVWMRGILDGTHALHELHVLDVPDEVCLARLHARNAQGDHPFAVSEAQFHLFARHYVPPTPGEGFTIVRHASQ
ncbi:MAG: ATP-binding protein [Pseudomonadota bacterium]